MERVTPNTMYMCVFSFSAVMIGIWMGFLWVNVMQSASVCPTLRANGHCLSQQKALCTSIWLQAQTRCMQNMCVQIRTCRCSCIVCVHCYTQTHTHTHTANRKSDALPLTDHSTLNQNSSKHLWASIPMFSLHVIWISYRKALCLSHTDLYWTSGTLCSLNSNLILNSVCHANSHSKQGGFILTWLYISEIRLSSMLSSLLL